MIQQLLPESNEVTQGAVETSVGTLNCLALCWTDWSSLCEATFRPSPYLAFSTLPPAHADNMLYVCVCVCVYIYIYIYIHINVYVYRYR